jgi:hypothetical protein
MDNWLKDRVREYITRNYPRHLDGLELGWLELEYKEIKDTDWRAINIYTFENDYRQIIGTVML